MALLQHTLSQGCMIVGGQADWLAPSTCDSNMAPALTAPDQPLGKTVWRFLWVNTLVSGLVWAFEMMSDISLPTGTSFVGHLLAIAAAMHQFVTHFETTMSLRDRFRFSAMAAAIAVATLAAEILLAVRAEGFELSVDGIAAGLGIDDLTLALLVGSVAIGWLVTFGITLAAVSFFVWLFRRSQEQGI